MSKRRPAAVSPSIALARRCKTAVDFWEKLPDNRAARDFFLKALRIHAQPDHPHYARAKEAIEQMPQFWRQCYAAWHQWDLKENQRVYALTHNAQQAFATTPVRSLPPESIIPPCECFYIVLPDNQDLQLYDPNTGWHRCNGFFVWDSRECKDPLIRVHTSDSLHIVAWGEPNKDSKSRYDDAVSFFALPLSADNKSITLEDIICDIVVQRGVGYTQLSLTPEGAKPAQTRSFDPQDVARIQQIAVQILRLAVNSILYLLYHSSDQQEMIGVARAQAEAAHTMLHGHNKAKLKEAKRALADLPRGRLFHLAPGLDREIGHRQQIIAQSRTHGSASPRDAYTVRPHMRWVVFGKIKDEHGNHIPAHTRPHRLVFIKGYNVLPPKEQTHD